MDFYKIIKCPYCKNTLQFDLKEYIQNSSVYERAMGPETEYIIPREEFKCDKCNKSFYMEGSFWEYPEGAYNYDDIEAISINQDEKI